jgi:hypothetical protein
MTIYYVSTTGSNSSAGTSASPFATLQHAHSLAKPGDTIYLRGGVYKLSTGIQLTNDGTASAPITITSAPGEKAVLDGAAMTKGGAAGYVLSLDGVSFNRVSNLEIRNGAEGGLLVKGASNSNILENLDVHHNGRLSQWEGKGVSLFGSSANNTLRNIDSHHNQDLNLDNADGFQIATTGGGNVLEGTRAWANSDDGYDFYNIQNGTKAGALKVINNWAWGNGWTVDGKPGGDGNGFKLGGVRDGSGSTAGAHIVEGNVAFGNKMNGFDENGSNGGVSKLTVYNNTAYNNGAYNYYFDAAAGHVFRNNVSYGTGKIKTTGTADHNSWDLGVSLSSADFASLDSSTAVAARADDGSLPVSAFLRPASSSDLIDKGAAVGRAYVGTTADLGAFEANITNQPNNPPTLTLTAMLILLATKALQHMKMLQCL